MTLEFSTLPTEMIIKGESVTEYLYLPHVVHLDDPASDVLLDFHDFKPLTVDNDTLMTKARRLMQSEKIDFTLVQDQYEQLAGVLSLKRILSEDPIKTMESSRLARDEVHVRAVMTPIEEVHAINFSKLKHAKVGHVIATLQKLQAQFALVIELEPESEKKMIRGIFTAAHINRLTGDKLSLSPMAATSVAEMKTKLHK